MKTHTHTHGHTHMRTGTHIHQEGVEEEGGGRAWGVRSKRFSNL